MRTYLMVLPWLMLTTSAQAASSDTHLRTFANCAGRLTAQLEHAWLLNDANAGAIEHQRAQIVDLLSAVIPADRGRDVLSWRVDARAAQRALLMRAAFGKDQQDAEWAAEMATQYVAECTGFLLS